MSRPLRMFLRFCCFCISTSALAQGFEFYPGAKYDAAIPTLKQVVGHHWGERITLHHEVERYINALQQAAPQRVKVVKYAETWEGKALYHLVIGSPANITKLEEIKAATRRLADPRAISQSEADTLIKSLPSIVWLVCGVHGNEISSTEAGLLTAYHLLAAQSDELVRTAMQNTIVVIDPIQNPDGRDRFIAFFRQNTGRWPEGDMQSAEHNEPWPGGRTNHYLFDMNRDWFAQTQPETQGRTRAYLEWFPQVLADLHEMSTDGTYYFAPPALPWNPNLTRPQTDWLARFGRNNAGWFDRFRFDYFTRENYDSFYPGYGEEWPLFHGSISMTYEQASVRGLLAQRSDETVIQYRDSIQHHFIASLSTIENTAKNREAVLRYFYDYRRTAIEEGTREQIKEYIITPGADPNRATRLAATLMQSGIEVKRADAPFSNPKARDYFEEKLQAREFPAGSYIISLAQPAKRMARTLLDKHTDQGQEFIEEQRKRYERRQPGQFYDVTAWSLPLLFDVPCFMAEQASSGQFSLLHLPPHYNSSDAVPPPRGRDVPGPMLLISGKLHEGRASLAYLIPWGTQSAASALADLFRQDVRVYSSDKAFKLNGVNFPRGTLIVKTKDNPADLEARMQKLATTQGVDIYPTESSWVDEGINFGSANVHFLVRPRIALAYNTPTSATSVGWVRYLIEQRYGYPVTTIRADQLRNADLSKYNVLILPDSAGYGTVFTDGQKLREWVSAGGTLVTFAGATTWLTDEKVNLLPTKRERRDKPGAKPDAKGEKKDATEAGQPPKSGDSPRDQAAAQSAPGAPAKDQAAAGSTDKSIEPTEEWPSMTPGAIVRVKVDREHWLGFGYGETTTALIESNRIFTPLKLDRGVNVATYLPEGKMLLSGLMWEDVQRQLPNKAFLMYVRLGRGHVVAFAEDPSYRAFLDGLNLMMLNALFLGPGH